jgi:hypothetical protein
MHGLRLASRFRSRFALLHRAAVRATLTFGSVLLVTLPAAARAAERTLHVTPSMLTAVRSQLESGAARVATDPNGPVVLTVLLGPGETLTGARSAVPLRVLGTGSYHGYAIAHVAVARADARRFQDAGDIVLATGPAHEVRARLQRADADRWLEIRRQVESLVQNPEALSAYAPVPSGPAKTTAEIAFTPTEKPSLEGSPVDMLILTRDDVVTAYQAYADARTGLGIPTVVRTVEWVEQNYPHGADLQETLRLFCRDAYELWGTRYVLIGGDTDRIPTRYAYSTYSAESNEVPTDLYYACLDGDWNADGDSRWAEGFNEVAGSDDAADLYPELYIGRLPQRTPAEVDQYRAKVTTFLEPGVTDYQNKLLFAAEVLWPAGWNPGDPVLKNGADFAERLIVLNHLDTGGYQLTKLYDTPQDYTGASTLTRQATINAMNAGAGLVTDIGHGFRYTMSLGDQSLTNVQAAALTNSTRPFFLVMLNCTAAAFDFPCLAEQFLLNSHGGAVGVIGAAREAFPDGSQFYLEALYQSLYSDPRLSVGQSLNDARLRYMSNIYSEGVFRWTNFITALLSDPTISIWRGSPKSRVVTHPSSLPLGTQTVAVQVTSGGSPVSGATVCLWKQGDFYALGTTGLSGTANVSVRAESPGTAQLSVSGAGLQPYRANVAISTSAAAALRVTGTVQVEDPAPDGNGNGLLEANETASLRLQVRNEGNTVADNVTLAVRTGDAYLSILDPQVQIASVVPAQTVIAPAVRVTMAPGTPDMHHVELQVTLTRQSQTWQDRVDLDLLQVGPRVTRLVVQDPDGNGTPGTNETYDLHVEFKNYGFAQVNNASSTLTSTDPDVTILDGNSPVGTIQHLATASATFTVREANVSQNNPLTVRLTDAAGRFWTFPIEVRRPSAPTNTTADPSAGPAIVQLTWSPSPSTDLAGYAVYRALQPAGPWTLASSDVVTSATYFGDRGLLGSTNYWYTVAALDASGNESVRTPPLQVKTNPLQKPGWPRVMGQWTSCSPVVAQVDADAGLEIFSGADRVYAWNADGTELRDGDANPATDGVFSPLGSGFTAALAAGDLDGDGKDEIVACSWDTHEVYAFDGNGSVLPGWPRSIASTTFGIWAAPAIADLDQNGSPEVIVLGLDGKLYAWHANGTEVRDGDANPATQGVFFVIPGTSQWSRGAPAIANILTSDASLEIVFGTSGNRIYMLRADGSVVPGWPRVVGDEVTAAPCIGDVDNDGTLDIAVPATDGFLYVLRANGTDLPGWPRAFESHWSSSLTPSVAMHDFDGDHKPELVVGDSDTGQIDHGKLWMFDWQGNVKPGWPVDVHTASESSPVIGDVDGDGTPEILYGGESGLVYGFRPDGSSAPGFPIRLGAEMRATPTITDVDGDGHTDVVFAGWDQQVYVWDFGGTYDPNRVPWGTFKADNARTGLYVPRQPTDTGDDMLPRRTVLHSNVPNPFNPVTRIRFEIAGSTQATRLQIFDIQGRLVRTLVNAALDPGWHERFWDGRDDRGRDSASGVYFYRLTTLDGNRTRKMTLLR